MDNFNINEFINKINAIEIDKSDEEWPQKFNEEFDKQVSKNEITNFKCVSNFIFIAFGTSLILYSYDRDKNELEQKEEHKIEKNSLFECWVETQEDILNNLYLAFPYDQEIIIIFYTINEWNFGNKLNIIR